MVNIMIKEKLRAAFYHPHCTIAYVKAGTAKKYIDKLNDMEQISVQPEKLVYSKANGDKKEYGLD